MAIRLPQGFGITSRGPIDQRFVLSKEQMLNIVESEMPPQYFALCSDDNQLYVYNKDNESSSETGKFIISTDDVDTKIEDLDNSLSPIAKSGNVNNLVQTTGDTLILDCNP